MFGLGALATAFATLGAGDVASPTRRFIFVQAAGGWDPLALFAPMFDTPFVQMAPTAERMQIGSFQLVGGVNTVQAAEFFERFGSRTLLLNGLSTRSVNHQACMAFANTGALAPDATDWATLLGAGLADQFLLPHLVINGTFFPGTHAGVVSRAQGMLGETVHGTVSMALTPAVVAPSESATGVVDAYLASRIPAAASGAAGTLVDAHAKTVTRAQALVANKHLVSIGGEDDIGAQSANAVQALSSGLSRCATIQAGQSVQTWDTHGSLDQTTLFRDLFGALIGMLDSLDATPSPDGTPLSESTVVVVLSEMGRTPIINKNGGRDHWPFTSALVIGPGITGGRTIGGFTDVYGGIGVDLTTGDLDHSRAGIAAEDFGATLLALGGIDPAEHLRNGEPIVAVLT